MIIKENKLKKIVAINQTFLNIEIYIYYECFI